ncbi:hypothetical protein BDW71DRAFT_173669 [Aspergillus fruticulosus]
MLLIRRVKPLFSNGPRPFNHAGLNRVYSLLRPACGKCSFPPGLLDYFWIPSIVRGQQYALFSFSFSGVSCIQGPHIGRPLSLHGIPLVVLDDPSPSIMHSVPCFALTAALFLLFTPACAVPDVSQFRVHSLPDGPPLPPSWAGRLPVPLAEPGNSLFFWLFQAEDAIYDNNLISWFLLGHSFSLH